VEFGPGQLSVDEVGIKTIATTTVVDARRSMAYAAAIGETNPAYFDDSQPDGVMVRVSPLVCSGTAAFARTSLATTGPLPLAYMPLAI